MSDKLLEQLAGEMMSVYVGDGQKIPRSFSFFYGDNDNIAPDERIVVTVKRVKTGGRLAGMYQGMAVADFNPT